MKAARWWVELFKDLRGGWRFRRVARNGEIVAASEAYTRRWSAKRAAVRLFPTDEIKDG